MVDGEAAKEEDDVETSVRLALEASPDDGADVAFQLESAEIEVIALPFQ